MASIDLTIVDGLASLTINNPSKRNALSQVLWLELEQHLIALAQNTKVRVVVLAGSGSDAFCAGADIEEISQLMHDKKRLADNNDIIQRVQLALELLPQPTLAKINGACFGGGCGLALACDFRIASESVRLAITPAKLGLLYSLADTRRLHNLVGPARARELLFLSKVIDGKTAADWGMVNALVAEGELDSAASQWLQSLSEQSQVSLRGMKRVLSNLAGSQKFSDDELMQEYQTAFTMPDCEEGCSAFLAKRKPDFK